jgi:hypothetical protein
VLFKGPFLIGSIWSTAVRVNTAANTATAQRLAPTLAFHFSNDRRIMTFGYQHAIEADPC